MKQTQLLVTLTTDQLKSIISEAIKTELEKINQVNLIEKSTDLLTRKQLMDYLSVSSTTLHNWNRDGILFPKQIGGRVFYEKSDVLSLTKKQS